jgi:dienelactone hydrolase
MRGHSAARAVLILAMLSCTLAPIASAEELVRVEGGPSLLDLIRQRQARERGETPAAVAETIDAYLSRPDGDDPFPAIVYLHGCGGLSTTTRHRIADLMTGWGYVTLAVDSFVSRGIAESCTREMWSRQGDALGALRYLSGLGFVDQNRIALVGAAEVQGFGRLLLSAVPGCSRATDHSRSHFDRGSRRLDAGERLRTLDACQAGKGAPVKLVVYPRAYHSFDNPSGMIGGRYVGHWLKCDADAAQRAIATCTTSCWRNLQNSRLEMDPGGGPRQVAVSAPLAARCGRRDRRTVRQSRD